MQKLCALTALFIISAAAHAQDPKPLQSSQVPWSGKSLTAFVPRGWHIEKQVNGDLNKDKRPDAALVLVQNKPPKDNADNPAPRARALVLALRSGNSWRRAGFSNAILLGTRDGGAFYGFVETPTDVSIQKGVVIIEQEAGSREVTHSTHRLRYDARQKRFFRIGYDTTTNDRLTAEVQTQSDNYLMGQRKTTIFKSNDSKTVKTSRVSRTLRSLESLTENDRL